LSLRDDLLVIFFVCGALSCGSLQPACRLSQAVGALSSLDK